MINSSADYYVEETARQVPSNTPFLVAQHSPTYATYRWKIKVDTDLSTPRRSEKFGPSSQWFLQFGGEIYSKHTENTERTIDYSFWLCLDPGCSTYVHFYMGKIGSSSGLLCSVIAKKGRLLPATSDLMNVVGFRSFVVANHVKIGDIVVLEIGIETQDGQLANPYDRRPVALISSRLTMDDIQHQAILPQDIFYCSVCHDICDYDAVLCAAGEHVLCREHIMAEHVNLCGCCQTNNQSRRSMPPILQRLYRTLLSETATNTFSSDDDYDVATVAEARV